MRRPDANGIPECVADHLADQVVATTVRPYVIDGLPIIGAAALELIGG